MKEETIALFVELFKKYNTKEEVLKELSKKVDCGAVSNYEYHFFEDYYDSMIQMVSTQQ